MQDILFLEVCPLAIKSTLIPCHLKHNLRRGRTLIVTDLDLVDVIGPLVKGWRIPVKFTLFKHIRGGFRARREPEKHDKNNGQSPD